MDINIFNLDDIFNYRVYTNEEKQFIKLDYDCVMYNIWGKNILPSSSQMI